MSCLLSSGYEAVGLGRKLHSVASSWECVPMGSAGSPVCEGRSQDLATYEPITVMQ